MWGDISFCFFNFYFLIVVQLIYSVSGIQQSELALSIYKHISIYIFYILFHYSLWEDIQCSSLCYTLGPCCLSILHMKSESVRLSVLSDSLQLSLWLKPLIVRITTNSGIFLMRWEYQTTLPASWETCKQDKKWQLELDMEQQTGSKLRKEYVKTVYCHPII